MKWARRRPTVATAYALAVVVTGMFVVGAVIVALWMQALESKRQTETANRDIQNQMELTAEARNAALQREGEAKHARQLVEVQKGQVEQALRGETTAKRSLMKTQQELIKTKYYHDVSLAHRECAEGNIDRADQLLGLCPKELRGWEWWHCHFVAHPELAGFTIPECLDLTFSPNGEQLVVCNKTSQIEYRNANSGALLKKVAISSRAPPAVAVGERRAAAVRDLRREVREGTAPRGPFDGRRGGGVGHRHGQAARELEGLERGVLPLCGVRGRHHRRDRRR